MENPKLPDMLMYYDTGALDTNPMFHVHMQPVKLLCMLKYIHSQYVSIY